MGIKQTNVLHEPSPHRGIYLIGYYIKEEEREANRFARDFEKKITEKGILERTHFPKRESLEIENLKWFSERKGLKKTRVEIQVNSIDEALRNRLWNVFLAYYLQPMSASFHLQQMKLIMMKFWDSYLKLPINFAPESIGEIWKETGEFFKREWYELFDLLEFVVAHFPNEQVNEEFIKISNVIFEEELSAYRFVGKQITQVTSAEEISEIEEALKTPFKTVNTHLEHALKLMSDRKSPDYRNSIKESISAVEAVCRIIAEDEKATLGQALDIIEKKGKIELHKALKRAFDSLYGYTSSAEGIRHSMLDEKTNLSFEDAKFILVSCSAFINYLISKSSKAGLKIGE